MINMGVKSFWEVPTEDGLRIGYLNVDGARNKIDQIEYLAHRYQLDVFFVAETKQDNKVPYSEVGIKDYKIVKRNDKTRNGGGILVYVKPDLSTKHLTDGSIGNTQYIQLSVTIDKENNKSIDITGVYIPPDSTDKSDKRYQQYLETLSTKDNAILMGDVNTWRVNVGIGSGIENLCVGRTRFEVKQKRGSDELTVEAGILDHIVGNNLNDVKVVERGALYCGISDHALIYCTVRPKREGGLSDSFVKHGDLLQHDVPLLLSALIVGGDNYDKLTIKSPKFWVMARKMETKRIEISELIHIIKNQKNHENLKALQKIQKSPVKFCEELSTSVRDLGSLLKSSIENVRTGSFQHSLAITSQKSIYDELEWYLYTGVRSNKLNENIFLNSRTMYLNFCFPAAQTMLTAGIRVVNPEAIQTEQQLVSLSDYMIQGQFPDLDSDTDGKEDNGGDNESVVVFRYERNETTWQIPGSSSSFWKQLPLDSCQQGWSWIDSLPRLSDPKQSPIPLGLIEFTNLLYHVYVSQKLRTTQRDTKKHLHKCSCRNSEEGVVLCKIKSNQNIGCTELNSLLARAQSILAPSETHNLHWSLLGSDSNRSNLIEDVGSALENLGITSTYRSVQTLIDCENTISADLSYIISIVLSSSDKKIRREGIRAPRFWLDLPQEWIIKGIKQGKITKYTKEFHKQECTTCKKASWDDLILNLDAEHSESAQKQCVRDWLEEIKSSVMNGVMFLHSEIGYFNLHVLPELLRGYWNSKKIVGISAFWNCDARSPLKSIDSIKKATDKDEALLMIRYEASTYWHTTYEEEFWNQQKGLIWDDIDPHRAWSELVESRTDPYPSGVWRLDNTICHRHLQYQLKDTLNLYRGDIVFTDRYLAFVYLRIPLTHCKSDSTEMLNITAAIEKIMQTFESELNNDDVDKQLFYTVSADSNIDTIVSDQVADISRGCTSLTIMETSYEEFSETTTTLRSSATEKYLAKSTPQTALR